MMIGRALRGLKQFFWQQTGITHLDEKELLVLRDLAALRAEVAEHGNMLRSLLGVSASPLAEVKALLQDQAGALPRLSENFLRWLSEVTRTLEQAHSERSRQLEQQVALLHQVCHDLPRLVAKQVEKVHPLIGEVKQHTERALDHRLGAFESLKSLPDHLRPGLEQLATAIAEVRAAGERIQLPREEWEQRLATMTASLQALEASRQMLERLQAEQQDLSGFVRGLGLDKWRIKEYEGLLRYFRRQQYDRDIESGKLEVPRLETEHPEAATSNDTLYPRGAMNDNSICLRFNRKLQALLANKSRLKVLDLGCAGGGFVRSLIDEGHLGVGLEGCPWPKINQAGEWATIPHHLHTCDVTKPFTLADPKTNEPIQFDAITAWEVMEHIPINALPGFLANLDRHLAADGLFLCSVATFVDWDEARNIVYHVTVRSKSWWIARFEEAGYTVHEQELLDKDDWLRGSGNCRGDWHEDQKLGFHLILRRGRAWAQAAA